VKVRFSGYTLDWNSRQLSRGQNPVDVAPKALELLKLLIDHRPRALSKAELHERLWPSTFVSDGTLTSLVAELRREIGDRGRRMRLVRTVHRFGYSFSGEVTESEVSPPRGSTSCWLVWDAGRAMLREGENILGRDRGLAAWFESIDVSRRHARISLARGEAVLEDLQSRNGTFVAGDRITGPHRLTDGDHIGLGSVLVTFRAAPADASTQSRANPPATKPRRTT
jgi:DNA-binding winged helix-turn-helix (wHTH) protein